MKVDDLILVSIDDHVVEPPDMFLRHIPVQVPQGGASRRHRRQGRGSVDLPGQAAGPFPLRRETTTVSITVRPSAVTVTARNSSARSMQ